MKKYILYGIYVLLLIFMFSVVYAVEYNLDAGDSVSYGGKVIKLVRVGSANALIIDVSGITDTISKDSSKIINELEISNINAHYDPNNQAASSATIEIFIPGEICHIDNFCDFKDVGSIYKWNGDYRGKSVSILDSNFGRVVIEVDGVEKTIRSQSGVQHSNAVSNIIEDPLNTVAIVSEIGIRNAIEIGGIYLGENFANCPADCKLGGVKDSDLIDAFCHNTKKDSYTEEDDVDCGGLCKRSCNQECLENRDCRGKCDYVGDVYTDVETCYCNGNNNCVDVTYCEFDSDCIQIKTDLCGCKFTAINKEQESYWNSEFGNVFSSRGCLNPCDFIDHNPICENNKCKLSDGISNVSRDNLYKFIDNIVKNNDYTIVLGDNAPSTDTLVASEINLKFQQYSNLETNLPVELASRIKNKNNLILIGHPCDNPLISNPSCDAWPYGTGQSLIKISGNNLIIAGATPEGTRNAAEIVANYRDHPELGEKSEIVIGEKTQNIEIQTKQEQDSETSSTTQIPTSKESLSEESQIEQSKEEQEYKGILRRFINWIIGLFR